LRLPIVLLCLGAVWFPGMSGALLCGVLGMSQPLANIGVSGRLQDVCRWCSSWGLCEERFWNGFRFDSCNSMGRVRLSDGMFLLDEL
jgi:hypothetical protein